MRSRQQSRRVGTNLKKKNHEAKFNVLGKEKFLVKHKIVQAPPYSLDIAPCDFFPKLKIEMIFKKKWKAKVSRHF